MRISDWSSDVCSSDLHVTVVHTTHPAVTHVGHGEQGTLPLRRDGGSHAFTRSEGGATYAIALQRLGDDAVGSVLQGPNDDVVGLCHRNAELVDLHRLHVVAVGLYRSEEHPSELQSLMRNSYAVFCL